MSIRKGSSLFSLVGAVMFSSYAEYFHGGFRPRSRRSWTERRRANDCTTRRGSSSRVGLLRWMRYAGILAVLMLGLVSIIGTGGGDATPTGPSSGAFVNSPVEGLYYKTPTYAGWTDADGTFPYEPGEEVEFYLGGADGLFLGTAPATGVVRPDDIADTARATRIGQLLQTLDGDGNTNNGIGLPDIAAYLEANSVDLDDDDAFETSMTALLAALNADNVFDGPRTLVSAAAARAQLDAAKSQEVVVSTQYGDLAGFTDGTVAAWRGIPYAKPPVGELRWEPPQDPEPWTGTRLATNSGPRSLQFEMTRTWQATGNITGSEDCLYLDVFRPDTDDGDLPVYVWIHGGSNKFGSAVDYFHNARAMAEKRNVVVVLVQYRLGPLGWFRHAALRDEDILDYGNSGNFGTLDQIKALEWIQGNIEAFGGDPGSVTIAGQSAGGHNVMNLVISPLAEGLFHRAVAESGVMPVIPADMGETITEAAGYAELGAEDLRAIPAAELLATMETALGEVELQTYNAFADGYVIPDTVINALDQGNYNEVPIIIGYNRNEWNDLLLAAGDAWAELGKNWGMVYDIFDPDFDEEHEWTYEEIFPNENEERIFQDLTRFTTLNYRVKYLDELCRELRENQDDVYAYIFEWAGGGVPELDEFATIFGAAHSMEIPFFFGGPDSLFGYSFIPENEAGRIALQDAMGAFLRNFMETGDPRTVAGAEWEPWSNEDVTGVPKAITFNADAEDVVLGFETEELSYVEKVEGMEELYITEEMAFPDGIPVIASAFAAWDPAYLDPWWFVAQSTATCTYEQLRFVERNHLQLEALAGAETYGGTYGYYVNPWSGYQVADYWIEMPDNWNGDLVLYCHGYQGDDPELSLSMTGFLREHLVENGYEIATGVVGTRTLLDYFAAVHGDPGRVYITGHSMGGHITARSVTEYPEAYDGAMPMCGVVGGAMEQFSFSTDMALLANCFTDCNFKVPMTEENADLLVALTFGIGEFEISPLGYIPPLPPASMIEPYYYDPEDPTRGANPDWPGAFFMEASMYRSGGWRPLWYEAFSNMTFFQVARQGYQFIVDPTAGTGMGNVVDNAEYQYYLNDEEGRAYLNDTIQRIATNPDYLAFSEAIMYPVSGDITIPVLSMHDIGDFFVPFSHEILYAEKVDAAGESDLLRTRVIRSVNHCGMNAAETTGAFDDLVNWVVNGVAPAGDDILNPETMAAPHFGCQFTTEPRPEDTYFGTYINDDKNDYWICECWQDPLYDEPPTWYPEPVEMLQ
ncbi:MAG TPA: hypothetical protein ENN35_01855 [Deltaproteobacteria bacterium]|nr:hypothetical protein [Deltaproteobacteria bacterium]